MNCSTCQNQQTSMQGSNGTVSGGAVLAGMFLLLLGLFGYSVVTQQQEPR